MGGGYQLEDAIRRRLSRGCYIFWRLSMEFGGTSWKMLADGDFLGEAH